MGILMTSEDVLWKPYGVREARIESIGFHNSPLQNSLTSLPLPILRCITFLALNGGLGPPNPPGPRYARDSEEAVADVPSPLGCCGTKALDVCSEYQGTMPSRNTAVRIRS